ncbi:MAG: PKD domain-containing protein [Thermoplasmata archaeon]|nr:PKD domain-containing protein [Thermoplasmata archaeon]
MRISNRRTYILIVCMLLTAAVFGTLPANVVAQNDPPVADAGGPYTAPEGTAIVFDASGSTDPNPDVLQYRWDFDNDGLWDTSFSTDPTAVNTWFDDYSGLVVVNVSDGEFNITDTADVTVTNADPILITGQYDTVDEGQPFSVVIEFTDPGPFDQFLTTVTVDGSGHGGLKLPVLGLNDVTYGSVILHTTLYANDYKLDELKLKAEKGKISSYTVGGGPHEVFSPSVTEETISLPLQFGETANIDIEMEPEPITTCGDQTEIWALQWHTISDGLQISTGIFTNATQKCPLSFDKSIGDDCGQDFHTIKITISDLNGGMDFDLIEFKVNNVAPDVYVRGPDPTVDTGDEVHFNGSFKDPGWLDTHTIEWDFGDGYTDNGSLTPTHTYSSSGTYTVTLNVTDDDGGVGTDTLTVTVEGEGTTMDWTPIYWFIFFIVIAILLITMYLLKSKGRVEDE